MKPHNACFKLVLLSFSCCILLGNCSKEAVFSPEIQQVNLPLERDLMSVCFRDSLHGVVTGGTLWKDGVIFSTQDGGQHWRVDTLLRNRIECVRFNKQGEGFACGVDGLALHIEPEWGHWGLFRQDWFWAKSCAFPNEHYGVMVGGEGWKQGQTRLYGPDYIWQQDSQWVYNAELNDVCFADSMVAIAVGMGWVARSQDAGKSWKRLPIEGDFFRSVCFPDEKTGYLCGYQGSIYKTEDGAQNWIKIRDGGPSARKNKGFKSLYFVNANEGWIVGDKGLVWRTEDGGTHWSVVTGIPDDMNCTGVFADTRGAWVTGLSGQLFYLKK